MATSTVFRLLATILGQTGSRDSRLVAALLDSSPDVIRNGFPSTTNCVALPCFCNWGTPEARWAWLDTVGAAAQSIIPKTKIRFVRIHDSIGLRRRKLLRHGAATFFFSTQWSH